MLLGDRNAADATRRSGRARPTTDAWRRTSCTYWRNTGLTQATRRQDHSPTPQSSRSTSTSARSRRGCSAAATSAWRCRSRADAVAGLGLHRPELPGNAAPGSWGGHAVPISPTRSRGLHGRHLGRHRRDDRAVPRPPIVEEGYAIISQDWFTRGRRGRVRHAALTADLAELGGQAPPPPPPPGPTGADVQAKLTAAVHELFQTQVGYVGWLERVRGAQYEPPDGSSTHWGKGIDLIDAAFEEAGKL